MRRRFSRAGSFGVERDGRLSGRDILPPKRAGCAAEAERAQIAERAWLALLFVAKPETGRAIQLKRMGGERLGLDVPDPEREFDARAKRLGHLHIEEDLLRGESLEGGR